MVQKGNVGRRLATAALAAVFVVSGSLLATYLWEGRASQTLVNELRQAYRAEPGGTAGPGAASAAAPGDAAAPASPSADPLAGLRAVCPDAVGWLTVPGTAIDVPVVQGSDNVHYLTHDAAGQRSGHGAIFLDSRNDPDDRQLALYGHHMRDGSQFAPLASYRDAAFRDAHPTVTWTTAEGTTEWTVFAVTLHEAGSGDLPLDFGTDGAFAKYVDGVRAAALYKSGVDPTGAAQILTLVTCAYDTEDARLLVFALRR